MIGRRAATHKIRLLVLWTTVWLLAGCQNGAAVVPVSTSADVAPTLGATPPLLPTATATTAISRFTVVGEVPGDELDDISAAIDASAARICTFLAIPCDFPVTVEVFPSQAAFDQGLMNPDMRGYYAVSGNGRIQMVSPTNSGRAGLSYEDAVGVAVHEFAHLALDEIDPELPTWLDEGMAVYLGPHDLYDQACREHLPGVQLPSVADLREHYADVPAADLFAYTLVASIARNTSPERVKGLLHEPDMEETLGQTEPEIEAAWREFIDEGCDGTGGA